MKLRTVKYYFIESLKSFFRNRFMSLASVTSITATLLVIGIFVMLALNFDYVATNIESQVEMKAFLIDGLGQDVIESMKKNVESLDGVKSVTFESKTQALEKFKEKFSNNSYLLEGLDDRNPLPDSLIVTMTSPNSAKQISDGISKMSNIENVVYGKEVLDKLLKLTYALRVGCLLLIVVLLVISTFIIANTIKLTVFARRREISIMKFVGATDWFVRWPFIIEGIIIGIIGSIITVFTLSLAYMYFVKTVSGSMLGIMSFTIMPFSEIIIDTTFFVTCIGIFIGFLGSMISVRKFLKV